MSWEKTCIEVAPSKDLADFLVVKTDRGNRVHFHDFDEAKEFLKLWFGFSDYEIQRYMEKEKKVV